MKAPVRRSVGSLLAWALVLAVGSGPGPAGMALAGETAGGDRDTDVLCHHPSLVRPPAAPKVRLTGGTLPHAGSLGHPDGAAARAPVPVPVRRPFFITSPELILRI